jgi:thiamine-phosphate pyrophosphorylase
MNNAAARLTGLYAITDAGLQPDEQLEENVALAIEGGASIIQYRDKSANHRLRQQQARLLAALCDTHNVLLIINDDSRLAADCGAAGVHLGQEDSDLPSARKLLGDNAIIGISCYNRPELAEQAAEQGADYIAFGRFFASGTKPDAVQATPELITDSKQRWGIPVAAIGGITPDNAGQLLDAGADMLAVVRGVFAAADIRQAAAEFAQVFKR